MKMITGMLVKNKPYLNTFNKNLNTKTNEPKKSDKDYSYGTISFQGAQALRAISSGIVPKNNLAEISDYKIKKVSQFIQEKLKEIIRKDSKREVPVFKKVREGFIKNLAQKIAKNSEKSIKVAVAGESASGKTYFANQIMKVCEGFNQPNLITMVSCDNYYKPRKGKIDGEPLVKYLKRTKYNLDCPDAVNLPRFKKEVERLASGETFKIPRLDFKTSTVIENAEEKKPARVILTEGLFTLIDEVKDIFDVCTGLTQSKKFI